MTTYNPNWALEAVDKAAQAGELEDLVADIKSTLESYFYSDEIKIKFIRQAIIDAGY